MASNHFVGDYLTVDHRRLDLLFDGLIHGVQDGKPLEYQQSLFQLFKTGLLRHIHWEEKILFPIFDEATGRQGGPTHVMCAEHKQMHGMLNEIEANMPSGFDEDVLMALGHFLANHNEKEENVLYPAIDQLTEGVLKESVAISISRDFK